jgi:glutathione reductase (NADPH)
VPHFDLIIVGTGVAGRTAAQEAAKAGLRTAIVDRREFGGTCALRGCEPKKVLVAAADAVWRVRGQRGNGVAGEATLNWPELIAFKRRATIEGTSAAFEEGFRSAGQTPLHGEARFVSPHELEIGGERFSADAIFLGTGAMPRPLGIPGAELVTDSERFMDLDELPPRVAFLGGGLVSFEFAAIAAAAGASVTILHRSEHPLKEFDPDLVSMLIEQYAEWGITVRLNAPVTGVERRDDGLAVKLGDGSELACDLAVHGAGRIADLSALDLATGEVACEPRGVVVNDEMRSLSNPLVWAAGDATTSGPPLTPVAIAQARVAIANIAEPRSARWDPAVVPQCCFSQPALVAVGLSEHEARKRGLDVEVNTTDTSDWVSTKRVGLTHTGAKTVVERNSGRILGAHVLAHDAEEIANVFALAVARGVTVDELKHAIWAYPTASSEIVYML